jgi:hypothetical protein
LLVELEATVYWDLIPGTDRGCILLYYGQIGSAAYKASYSMDIRSYFLGDNAVTA